MAHVGRALALITLVLPIVIGPSPVWAGAPTDQLKSQIDRVLKILEDPELKKEGKQKDRRTAVRQVANEIFDFSETAKRSLARHWATRTPAEREEFVQLFSDLLERSYISKIELYGGEKIVYSGERVDADLATVSTRIMTKNVTEVPVDYRLFKRSDRWMIYDVSVEGISLVSNYRTQFNKIIQTNGYNGLVEKMKTKQTEFAEEEAQKKKVKN